MTDAPIVTIVTATRNRCALLKEAVQSVMAQDFRSWQMVVVDDASEDDTWRWLSSLGDARVRGLRLERRAERSAARNLGLDAARGRYVLFLDDDDLLPPTALAHHVRAFQRNDDVVASVGSRVLFDEAGSEVTERLVVRPAVLDVWPHVVYGWVSVVGATLFDSAALRAVGGWDPSYVIAEDYELWTRVAQRGLVVISPDVVLRYRVHAGQWRSANYRVLMDQIREVAVERSVGQARERGQAALEARRLVVEARGQASRDRHARALVLMVRAWKVAPEILRSPLAKADAMARPIGMARCALKAPLPAILLTALRRRRGPPDDRPSFRARIAENSDGRWPETNAPEGQRPMSAMSAGNGLRPAPRGTADS
jgi:GT2 family glycosyltransferase